MSGGREISMTVRGLQLVVEYQVRGGYADDDDGAIAWYLRAVPKEGFTLTDEIMAVIEMKCRRDLAERRAIWCARLAERQRKIA